MFTRIVELTAKPGKNRQLADAIDEKVLPILKKQKGFVDETVYISDKDDNRVLAQGFWNTKEDAEQYHPALNTRRCMTRFGTCLSPNR